MIAPKISFVIPIFNEAENIPVLLTEIYAEMKKIKIQFEVLVIDDGSRDLTAKTLTTSLKKFKHLTVITQRTNLGKATALRTGFFNAKGKWIITMDGDLQDNPKDLPQFIEKLQEGYDVICGWKYQRKDSRLKVISSVFFNAFTSLFFDGQLHDMNTGYKAISADLAKKLKLYGEMHRYIPLMAISQGYKVTEVKVHHRKRLYGKSKYNLLRFLYGPFDLATVLYLTKFQQRPLHIFGFIGMIVLLSGVSISLYLTLTKIIWGVQIGQRPLLLLGALLIIVGVQIIFFGLIGEQITFQSSGKLNYDHVAKITKSRKK